MKEVNIIFSRWVTCSNETSTNMFRQFGWTSTELIAILTTGFFIMLVNIFHINASATVQTIFHSPLIISVKLYYHLYTSTTNCKTTHQQIVISRLRPTPAPFLTVVILQNFQDCKHYFNTFFNSSILSLSFCLCFFLPVCDLCCPSLENAKCWFLFLQKFLFLFPQYTTSLSSTACVICWSDSKQHLS